MTGIGNAELDRLALQTLHSAQPFPSPPASLQTVPLSFTITFDFR